MSWEMEEKGVAVLAVDGAAKGDGVDQNPQLGGWESNKGGTQTKAEGRFILHKESEMQVDFPIKEPLSNPPTFPNCISRYSHLPQQLPS